MIHWCKIPWEKLGYYIWGTGILYLSLLQITHFARMYNTPEFSEPASCFIPKYIGNEISTFFHSISPDWNEFKQNKTGQQPNLKIQETFHRSFRSILFRICIHILKSRANEHYYTVIIITLLLIFRRRVPDTLDPQLATPLGSGYVQFGSNPEFNE